MKLGAILRIILFSAIALVLIGVLMAGITGRTFLLRRLFGFQGEKAPVTEETAFAPSDIDQLTVNWAAGEVRILTAAQDEITVTEDREDSSQPMVLRRSGSSLAVDFSEDGLAKNLSVKQKNLTVTVPNDWNCRKLELNAASAKLSCSDLALAKLEISTASGKVSLQNCSVDSVKMSSASGNLDFSGSLQTLEFDGVSARADIAVSNAPEKIKMDSVSGDLNLTLPEDCGFTLSKSTLSGSLKTDFEVTTQGDKTVSGDGACRIEMTGLSGGIHIYKAN